MGKSRIEAFSDGVIAIVITIMVLELKVPHAAIFNDLLELSPVFISFIYVGIYWNKLQHAKFPSNPEWLTVTSGIDNAGDCRLGSAHDHE